MTKLSVSTLIALTFFGAGPSAYAKADLWTERSEASPALAQVPDFATLAAQVVPAVVSIHVTQKVALNRARGRGGEQQQDPFDFFHRFFGGEIPHEFENQGLGSGFVIEQSGVILTNFHVVENADNIEVTYGDKPGQERTVQAKVVGTAPDWDVALIQTAEKISCPIAFLGDSDRLKIGDWVMAVGNPFGLSHSVSVGIVSARDRRDVVPSGRVGVYDFIQTDASINPGNSGGPLVNMRGEVIGINSAINAAGSGIGFAIPINMIKRMLPDLREKGRFARSWLGLQVQPVSAELAESYGLDRPRGALVNKVVPNSPSAEAGIKEGDIVLKFEDKEVHDNKELPILASMAGVGKEVRVAIWRDKSERIVKVKLGNFPKEEEMLAEGPSGEGAGIGITVTDVTPEMEERYHIGESHGALVKTVEPGSPAARARLQPGDLIMGLNGKSVESAGAFAASVRALKAGSMLRLKVLREGDQYFVAVRKP